MPSGRPRLYPTFGNSRGEANARAAQRARAQGIVTRSVGLPVDCWSIIRAARAPGETSDAQTLARLLQAAIGSGAG